MQEDFTVRHNHRTECSVQVKSLTASKLAVRTAQAAQADEVEEAFVFFFSRGWRYGDGPILAYLGTS